jgi:hypothetical protein
MMRVCVRYELALLYFDAPTSNNPSHPARPAHTPDSALWLTLLPLLRDERQQRPAPVYTADGDWNPPPLPPPLARSRASMIWRMTFLR